VNRIRKYKYQRLCYWQDTGQGVINTNNINKIQNTIVNNNSNKLMIKVQDNAQELTPYRFGFKCDTKRKRKLLKSRNLAQLAAKSILKNFTNIWRKIGLHKVICFIFRIFFYLPRHSKSMWEVYSLSREIYGLGKYYFLVIPHKACPYFILTFQKKSIFESKMISRKNWCVRSCFTAF
jgi:hypothetical protein